MNENINSKLLTLVLKKTSGIRYFDVYITDAGLGNSYYVKIYNAYYENEKVVVDFELAIKTLDRYLNHNWNVQRLEFEDYGNLSWFIYGQFIKKLLQLRLIKKKKNNKFIDLKKYEDIPFPF